MTYTELVNQIRKKHSFLCVGLDSDINKIPPHLIEQYDDPVFEFNRQIIDATHQYTVAYKPNIAFYESEGLKGWQTLEKTINYLNQNYPEVFTIADAKRGDIGNTSKMYAKAFLKSLDFDSVTVAPYMGEDSVTPFLEYENKWVILLALTSNSGAFDFQFLEDQKTNQKLFQRVLYQSQNWGKKENMMFVVGATKAEMLADIRKIVPEHFLLVPGVGAQGGSLKEVVEYGMNSNCGLLVNSSRAIIFADNSEKFSVVAAKEAEKMQSEMKEYLKRLDL